MRRPSLAEIGPAHLRMATHLVGRAAGDDAPIDEHRDPVGEAEHGIDVVLDQQHGPPAFERFEQRSDARRFVGSHARHRLVEQQDPRAGRQRKADLELPALAMRQRAGELIGAGAEPNGVELGVRSLARSRSSGRAGSLETRAPGSRAQ